MRLNDYLKSKGVTQTQFGLSLNPPMTQMRISHLITGRTRISLRRSVEIQRVTNGAVTVFDWLDSETEQEAA